MRMRTLLVVGLLVAGGCRKSEEKTTVKTPEGTVHVEGDKVTVQTDQGRATIETKKDVTRIQTNEGTVTIGENKVPDGFPLPVMRGARIEQGSHMAPADGRETFQLTIRVPGPARPVAEFYEKALKDKGLKVTRTEQTNDEIQMVMLAGESGAVEAMAVVQKEAKAADTTAMISWNVRKKTP